MGFVKITFIKDFATKKQGETLAICSMTARQLINEKVAVMAEGKEKALVEDKTPKSKK